MKGGGGGDWKILKTKLRGRDPENKFPAERKLIERFHSRDYWPYWFTETKESICIKIEFNSQRFSLGHQHGRHFFVLGHQHGRPDVM